MCSFVCDNVSTYLGTYGGYNLTLGYLSPIASLVFETSLSLTPKLSILARLAG